MRFLTVSGLHLLGRFPILCCAAATLALFGIATLGFMPGLDAHADSRVYSPTSKLAWRMRGAFEFGGRASLD